MEGKWCEMTTVCLTLMTLVLNHEPKCLDARECEKWMRMGREVKSNIVNLVLGLSKIFIPVSHRLSEY